MSLPTQSLSSSGRAALGSAWQAFAGLMVYSAVYRCVLWHELSTSEAPPRSMVWVKYSAAELFLVSSNDVHFCLAVAVLVGALSFLRRRLGWSPGWGRALLVVLGLGVGFTTATHFRLLFTLGSGLDVEALLELSANRSALDVGAYSEPVDWVLALLAAPLLWVQDRLPRLLALVRDLALVVALVGIYTLAGAILHPESYRNMVWRAPAVHLGIRVKSELFDRPTHHLSLERARSERQDRVPLLIDPGFLDAPRPGLPLPAGTVDNVVVIILESAAAKPILQPDSSFREGGVDPMPYLRGLDQRGVLFTQHQSTANTSIRAIFSILSGLYPLPGRTYYSGRPDVVVPALSAFVKGESFLFTPGRLESHFPRPFLENSGMHELFGFQRLKEMGVAGRAANGRDEGATVQAFLSHLDGATEPFVGVYYSYIPHFWYQDQGEEWRLLADTNERRNRYLNGLWRLDHLIQQIVDHLDQSGLSERTAVLIVGDHGEAFGEHEGNFTHSRMGFQENYHVPAVLLAPGLAPGRFEGLTSHVDLLPSLLDLMGIPFAPEAFQGESLFRPGHQRYRFSVGSENALAAVDRDLNKVIIHYRKDRCQGYDLRVDPTEHQPLSCDELAPVRQALVDWRGHQLKLLFAYNLAIQQGEVAPFPAHPGLVLPRVQP